jgi:hypothetical protein
VYPDPKHWLKIFAKTEIFRENHLGNKNFSRICENENFRENFRNSENCRETKFREKCANFRLFSLFAKMEKGVFVSALPMFKRSHIKYFQGRKIQGRKVKRIFFKLLQSKQISLHFTHFFNNAKTTSSASNLNNFSLYHYLSVKIGWFSKGTGYMNYLSFNIKYVPQFMANIKSI